MRKVCSLLLFSLTSFLLSGCSHDEDQLDQAKELAIRPVKTVFVLRHPICLFPTSVSLSDITSLAFSVKGQIKKVYVRENEVVVRGQKLVALKNQEIKKELQTLTKKQAKLLKKKKKNKGEDTEEKLAAVEKAIIESKKQLEASILRAPSSGVVTDILQEKGDLVKKGQKVLNMQETANMYFLVKIPNPTADALNNQKLSFYMSSPKLPGYYFRLQQTKVQSIQDHYTLEFKPVEAEEMKGLLKDMPISIYGVAENTTSKRYYLRIPCQAVVADPAGRPQVWLVNLIKGTVFPRLVTTGRIQDGYIHVLDGLSEGDQIVVNGIDEMYEGKRIKVFFNDPVFLEELNS